MGVCVLFLFWGFFVAQMHRSPETSFRSLTSLITLKQKIVNKMIKEVNKQMVRLVRCVQNGVVRIVFESDRLIGIMAAQQFNVIAVMLVLNGFIPFLVEQRRKRTSRFSSARHRVRL